MNEAEYCHRLALMLRDPRSLVIPRDYSILLGKGRTADIQLLLDGSDSNTAAIALGVTVFDVPLRGDLLLLASRKLKGEIV